jgi:hypothetical protein
MRHSCAKTTSVAPNTVGHTSSSSSPHPVKANPTSPGMAIMRNAIRCPAGTAARSTALVRVTERVEGVVAVTDQLTYRVGEQLADSSVTPPA